MAAHEFIIADWDVIATYITPTYFNLEDTLALDFGFGFEFSFWFGYGCGFRFGCDFGYGFGFGSGSSLSFGLNYEICHRLWIRKHKSFNRNIFNVLKQHWKPIFRMIQTFVWFKQSLYDLDKSNEREINKEVSAGCRYENMINILFNERYFSVNTTTVWNMENKKKQHQSADVTDIPVYGMA